jgi:hypothetical protein
MSKKVTIRFVGEQAAGKTLIMRALFNLLSAQIDATFTLDDDLDEGIEIEDGLDFAAKLEALVQQRRDLIGEARSKPGYARDEAVKKSINYLNGNPGFTESRKVDVKDLLALAGVEKVVDLDPADLAPFLRLIEQLDTRPERPKVPKNQGATYTANPDSAYELDPFATQAALTAYHSDDSDYAFVNALETYFTTAAARNLPLPMKIIPGGVPGYEPLAEVLRDAYDQSAKGKGKERHANGKPFLMQPIMSIGRMVGPGYPLGQAMKKAQEAGGMYARGNTPAATAELLGVIVYTAAAINLMKEQEQRP